MDPAAVVAESGPSAIWIATAAVGLVGLGVGLALGRLGSGARRARELERELREAQAEMASYRSRVSEHFGETSRLLRDLTLQYRSVYEHLSEGARTLCPEGGELLPPSLAEAAGPQLEPILDDAVPARELVEGTEGSEARP